MNLRIWTWKQNARIRRVENDRQRELAFMTALQETLRHTQIAWNGHMHVTHAQRPSAPRPEQITLIWNMADGRQFRQFFPLHGQSYIQTIPNNFIWSEDPRDRPVTIDMAITYRDTGSPVR